MGDLVNLRLVRKRRARDLKQAEAAENRSKFGRTRQERDRRQDEAARADRHLDGHRIGEHETLEPSGRK